MLLFRVYNLNLCIAAVLLSVNQVDQLNVAAESSNSIMLTGDGSLELELTR